MDKEKSEGYVIGENEPAYSLVDARANPVEDLLLEKLERAIHKQTALYQYEELAEIAQEHDPIDLAKAATALPPSARFILYRNLPDNDAKVSFILNATSPTRQAVFRAIRNQEICSLLELMPADEAVDIIDELPVRRLKDIFERLSPQKAHHILELKKHKPQTAGRLMSNEFFAFSLASTVESVTDYIREHPGIEFTYWVFVLGEDGELLGVVPSRNLLVNPTHFPLRAIMQPVVHRVDPETSRDDVVELFERYRLAALPVVDEDQKLLGVIAQDDVVSMMEEIADETVAYIGGTAESLSEEQPTFKRYCSRAPWLVVTLMAGLTTATGFSIFQSEPWFLAVPFFVPLIAGMSGNVGIQCSTVLVRRMATGMFFSRRIGRLVLRELKIGVLIGVSFGLICGFAAYMLNLSGIQQTGVDPIVIGSMVSAGIMGACITATMLGTFSPIFFDRVGIDPAIASGPIVAACNDVMASYMFFFLAWAVAHLFAVTN